MPGGVGRAFGDTLRAVWETVLATALVVSVQIFTAQSQRARLRDSKLVILMGLQELKAQVERINAATTNIAADLRALKDGLNNNGLTAAEVAELSTSLESTAAALEAVADSTPDAPTA